MYVHTFHKSEDHSQRMLINMSIVDAIVEYQDGTSVITPNHTFGVSEKFDDVNRVWQIAMNYGETTNKPATDS